MLEGEVFLCIDRKLDHLFVLSTNFTQSCTCTRKHTTYVKKADFIERLLYGKIRF